MFAIASDVMNPQQTAAAIRQLRARLNLSQEELAARLNVSYATINRWEAGKSKPQRAQRDAIEALASEIGVEESFASDARPEAVATSGRRRRGVSHSPRSEEHTSELQSLMRISYAVFCLKKKKTHKHRRHRKHDSNTYT